MPRANHSKKRPNPHISRSRKIRSCPMSAWHSQGADTRTLTILAFSATAGALIEFYDFFIYGYAAATAFPAFFFLNLPPPQALAFFYLAFRAAFPARLIRSSC